MAFAFFWLSTTNVSTLPTAFARDDRLIPGLVFASDDHRDKADPMQLVLTLSAAPGAPQTHPLAHDPEKTSHAI
jgi:hypothetical protein